MPELTYEELERERDRFRERFFNEIKLRKYTFEILKYYQEFQFSLHKVFEFHIRTKEEKMEFEKECRERLKRLFQAKKDYEKRFTELDENLRRLQLL